MEKEIERNLGEQPLRGILDEQSLSHHDLVAASTDQLTHKMVSRGCKGRRLTPNVKKKILTALNAAAEERTFQMSEIFNY